MERYRNLSGDSGVEAYALGDGCIAVRFKSGVTYWYTDASAGAGSCGGDEPLGSARSGFEHIHQYPPRRKRWLRQKRPGRLNGARTNRKLWADASRTRGNKATRATKTVD